MKTEEKLLTQDQPDDAFQSNAGSAVHVIPLLPLPARCIDALRSRKKLFEPNT